MRRFSFICAGVVCAFGGGYAAAGPYSTGFGNTNPGAPDAAIPGFVGSAGEGKTASPNTVNPIFTEWANGAVYEPAPGVSSAFALPDAALGPVTGDNFDIVSLGDLNAAQIAAGVRPGRITLAFGRPIADAAGPDFAVFENSLATGSNVFAEFGYVDVSSDGIHFARFPSVSLTPAAVGPFGTVDPTNVLNLPGKHVNSSGNSWGTPFDLSQLASDPLVIAGALDLSNVNYVRITDIPGSGDFKDSLGNPIYDAWVTTGSGGFDLEALGVIHSAVPEPGMFGAGMIALTATLVRRRRA